MSISTILGALFDIFIVCGSLVDAVSDCYVTYEFYSDERLYSFFKLSMFFLILGSIIDGVAFMLRAYVDGFKFAEHLKSSSKLRNAMVGFVILLPLIPVAQLLPFIMFIIEKFEWNAKATTTASKFKGKQLDPWSVLDDIGGRGNDDKNETVSSDLQHQMTSAAGDATILRSLDMSVASRFKSFLLINIDEFVRVALCLVQLSAISIVGSPSPAQIFSLTLSLVNICAKLFQIASPTSFSVTGGFLPKLCFMICDVFTLACTASMIVAENSDKTATFFGIAVSELSWWYFCLKLVVACWVLLAVIGFMSVFLHERRRDNLSTQLFYGVIWFLVSLIGFVPVLLLGEAMKLSWFVLLVLVREYSPPQKGFLALIHNFLHAGGGAKRLSFIDWRLTYEAFLKTKLGDLPRVSDAVRFDPTAVKKLISSSFHNCLRAPRGLFHAEFEDKSPPLVTDEMKESTRHQQRYVIDSFDERCRHVMVVSRLLGDLVQAAEMNSQRTNPHAHVANRANLTDDTTMQELLDKKNIPGFYCRRTDDVYKDFIDCDSAPNISLVQMLTKGSHVFKNMGESARDFVTISIVFLGVFIVAFVAPLAQLCYPIIWYAQHGHRADAMQTFCVSCSSIFAVASLVSLPAFWRYFKTASFVYQFCIQARQLAPPPLIIDSFFSAPTDILSKVIPSTSLPEECFQNHILTFLDHKNSIRGLFGARQQDFEELLSTAAKNQ